MRNTILILAGIVVLAGALYWFMNRAEVPEDATRVSQATSTETVAKSTAALQTGTYRVDTDNSNVTWQAGKPAIAGYVHTGRFSLKSGSFVLTDESLSGEAVIDMNSLELLSLGGGKAGQESTLEGHLKSDRFFNVAAYPTATFRLTDISPKVLPGPAQTDYTATGELTMKGVTKTVTFPINVVTTSATEALMTASFSIDRTLWGITYGSAKVADKITDQIIGDEVQLSLSMKLTK